MSKATDVYTALLTRLQAVFPTYNRLTNPYSPDQNSKLILEKAYGIQVGGGVNTNRNVGCKLSVNRSFVVVLTQKFYSLELDRSGKQTGEFALLEAQKLLIDDLESDPALGDSASVVKSGFISDGGISTIFTDKDNFLILGTTLEIEYLDDLN